MEVCTERHDEEGPDACRHLWNRYKLNLRATKEWSSIKEKLFIEHKIDILREKAHLLGEDPAAFPELQAALATVKANTPPQPHQKVIESAVQISKLHRQGTLSSAAQPGTVCRMHLLPGRVCYPTVPLLLRLCNICRIWRDLRTIQMVASWLMVPI